MSSLSIPSLVFGGALVAVSTAAAVWIGSFRSSVYKIDHSLWDRKQRYYLDAEDEEVMTDPSSSYYPELAIRSDFFTSNEQSQSNTNITPELAFKLSIDVFDQALKSLADVAKWPLPYFQSTRQRREAERLCYYLLGVADTYMGAGPTSITPTGATHLSLTLLYLCAANLGLQEAYSYPIKRPRTTYGITNFTNANNTTCLAGVRIVEQSNKHAAQNSVITFYELIILFLLSLEEDEGAISLLGKLRRNAHSMAFSAFIHLRNDDWPQFRKTITAMMELIDDRHPMHSKLTAYLKMDENLTEEERMRIYDLPRLCQFFNDPFIAASD